MRDDIKICLDEIEADYDIMNNNKNSKGVISICRGWVRTHKAILKELNYKGKIPRQPKVNKRTSKKASDSNLFDL